MKCGQRDVIVVGGGVIGCATAFFLAREGMRIRVVEADALGSQASGVAVGLLAPLLGMGNSGPFLDFGLQGMQLIKQVIPTLEEDTDLEVGYAKAPIMLLAFTTGEEKEYKNDMVWRNTTGLTASWIDRQDVITAEGTASSNIRGASFPRGQIQVDSYRLVLAFARAAELREAVIGNGRAVGFTRQGHRATGVILTSGKEL